MGGAHETKRAFEKLKEFLNPVTRLEASQLKLASEFPHVLANASEEVDAPAPQLLRFGFGQIAPIAHDNAVLHPACQWFEQPAIINGRGR